MDQQPQIDLVEIRDEVESNEVFPNTTYVESEGENCLRVDYGNEQSVWLYSNGEVTGRGLTKTQKAWLILKEFRP